MHVVHRRVGVQCLELAWILGRAVVPLPPRALSKTIETQHVQHAHLGDRRPEQLRPLRQTRADEQSAVGAAVNRQPVHRSVVPGNEPLGGGDEVVEHGLLVRANALTVPDFPVLPATANIGDRKHATHFHPGDARGVKDRQARQPEAAIAIQQQRVVALQLEPLAEGEQQRDARAVVGGVEHLPLLERGGIEREPRRVYAGAGPGLQVIAVDGRRGDQVGERIERLAITGMAVEAGNGAGTGKGDLAARRTVQAVGHDATVRVVHCPDDQLVIDQGDARAPEIDGVTPLRDYALPVCPRRLLWVDRQHPSIRSVERGEEVKPAGVGADIDVGSLEALRHRGGGRHARREIDQVQVLASLVPDLPFTRAHDEPAAIGGQMWLELPVRMRAVLQHASVRRRAQRVIVQRVAQILGAELRAGLRRRKSAVVQALPVGGERRLVVLGEPQDIGQVAAGGQIADAPLGPVRARH